MNDMVLCVIKGDAVVQRTPDGLRWMRADPEIHLTRELWDQITDEGRTFLEAKYEIGEDCPYNSTALHARLRGAT